VLVRPCWVSLATPEYPASIPVGISGTAEIPLPPQPLQSQSSGRFCHSPLALGNLGGNRFVW